MQRSCTHVTLAGGGLVDRLRHRRRVRAVYRRGLVTCCALGLALLVLPASAHAEPSEQELQTKIDNLQKKAEILTEKYNGQRLELKSVRKDARLAREQANQLERKLRRSRQVVAEVAAARYKSGGMGTSVALLSARKPQQFIDRAAMLNHLSQQKSAQIQALQAALERAEHAQREAERAAKKVRKITRDIAKKKDRIKDLVAKVEDKLEEVRAESAYTPVEVGDYGAGLAAGAAEIAVAQQGDPYVWGAAGPDAFDCSGLAVYAYAQVGVSIPHYSGALWASYPHVSYEEMMPGDLVWTSSHHMGMYIGDGMLVHAPNSGEVVRVEDLWSFYGAVRVV